MSSDMQFDAYDRFKEFVSRNLTKGSNRKITLAPFDDMDEVTTTHMKLKLLNAYGSGTLFSKIEEYGAKLKPSKDITTGNDVYYVYVPWNTKKRSKHHKHSYSDDDDSDDEPPILIYCMLLMGTITAAALTTTMNQWVSLYTF